jgi:hypothetical protein
MNDLRRQRTPLPIHKSGHSMGAWLSPFHTSSAFKEFFLFLFLFLHLGFFFFCGKRQRFLVPRKSQIR